MRLYVSSLLLALVTPLLIPISATAQYIPTELPPLPGDETSGASGINAAGEVVGISVERAPMGDKTAVVWGRDGNPFALPTPPDCIIKGAYAINPSGAIVGSAYCASGSWHDRGVVWDRHGNPTVLPTLLGGDAFARDINASGLIVGSETDRSALRPIAVSWDRDGNPVELPRRGSYQIGSSAHGINNTGEIVGYIRMEADPARWYDWPVAWDRFGNPSLLRCPSGAPRSGPKALSISERGEVVGTCWLPSMPPGVNGVVWGRAGSFRELPPLPGDERSGAYDINVRGEVVGVSISADRRRTATVWDSDGNPTALPFLEPNDTNSGASGINAAGEIVGWSGARAVVWRPDRRVAP
jgi:uncharacterized membrane protein